jgi:HlyD family secretion protein
MSTHRKKRLTIIAAAAIVFLVGAQYWRAGLAQRPKFRTVPVMRGDLFIGVTATGTVEPVEIIDVGAQIVGSIKSFGPDADRPGKTIDYRSRVKQGDVLAQLDDLPARAELDKARVNLQLAEAELRRDRSKQKQAESNFRRAKELQGTDSVAEYENAASQQEMAQAETAMGEAKVEQAKIAVQQAEINQGYTVIRAPVEGVVIDRKVNVGQTVVAGMNAPSLFLLAKDLSHMLVWAAVNEADIGDVKVGQKVTFKVDAYRDRTFTGKVSQIRLNASSQQNVVMYGVVVDVDNTDGKLLPYMTAKLQFEVARRPNAILVPNQALRWQPTWDETSPWAREGLTRPTPTAAGQAEHGDETGESTEPKVETETPTVWTIAGDGLVQPVAVKVGLSDGMVTEITAGELEPGDAVVVNVMREAAPDFVSSFVSKVTDNKK